MGDAFGNGFELGLWKEDMVECKLEGYSLRYQGSFYRFSEAKDLANTIRNGVDRRELHDIMLLAFTEKWVFESVF